MKTGITTEQFAIAQAVLAQAVVVAAEATKLDELKQQLAAAIGDTTAPIYFENGGSVIINETPFKIDAATSNLLLKGVPDAVAEHFTETKTSVTATKIGTMEKSGNEVVRAFYPMLHSKLEKLRSAAQKKLSQAGKHLSVKVELPKTTETQ
ncbi:MAG: hypothetical protein WCY09_08165 [Candidatus Omnitrophota bacterium]